MSDIDNRNSGWSYRNGGMPVDAHRGHHRAYIRRYEREASKAVSNGLKGIAELTPNLLTFIADARNLRIAFDYLKLYGGQAPGPDRLQYSDLTSQQAWEMMRVLSKALREGTYRPGPAREQKIPKSPGPGFRTIGLQNIADRVVARGVQQILQPLIDSRFDANSFGFRPHRGRQHALRAALKQLKDGRNHWVVADIKDAFDNVPVSRLLQIVRKYLPGAGDELLQLINRVASTDGKRGIRQGNPLSPLLLNIYLDHLLDGVWRKVSPDEPLLRTADDCLVVCRSRKRARQARDLLIEIVTPTGMGLNPKKTGVHTLHSEADTVDWLGYRISVGVNGPGVRIAESAWKSLERKLEQAHDKPATPLRAVRIRQGWLDQLGPAYPYEEFGRVWEGIVRIMESLALEVPEVEGIRGRWSAGYARWRRLCEDYERTDDSPPATTEGSALDSFFSGTRDSRSDGVPSGAPSFSFSPGETVFLHTDGSYDPITRRGGWAAIIHAQSLNAPVSLSGRLKRTTNNRAELTAVIRGLERLQHRCSVRIVADSRYVVDGIVEHLPHWKSQNWRAGNGRRKRDLKNRDLWQRLDALLQHHTVVAEWTRGHSGDPLNEECDRLARAAVRTNPQVLIGV